MKSLGTQELETDRLILRQFKMSDVEELFYKGKYKEDKVYPLYIQKITCCFKIKENKTKNSPKTLLSCS